MREVMHFGFDWAVAVVVAVVAVADRSDELEQGFGGSEYTADEVVVADEPEAAADPVAVASAVAAVVRSAAG